MAISIGKMRKRVAIYTRTDSEAGEYSSEILRAIVSTVWANVVNVTGTAQVDSRNAGTGISHRITIRFRSDISKTNEILYDGWIYRIETMQELDDDAGRFMVLECNQICALDALIDISPERVANLVDAEGNKIFDAEGNPIIIKLGKEIIS